MPKPAVLSGPTADLFWSDFKEPIYELFATNASSIQTDHAWWKQHRAPHQSANLPTNRSLRLEQCCRIILWGGEFNEGR